MPEVLIFNVRAGPVQHVADALLHCDSDGRYFRRGRGGRAGGVSARYRYIPLLVAPHNK